MAARTTNLATMKMHDCYMGIPETPVALQIQVFRKFIKIQSSEFPEPPNHTWWSGQPFWACPQNALTIRPAQPFGSTHEVGLLLSYNPAKGMVSALKSIPLTTDAPAPQRVASGPGQVPTTSVADIFLL